VLVDRCAAADHSPIAMPGLLAGDMAEIGREKLRIDLAGANARAAASNQPFREVLEAMLQLSRRRYRQPLTARRVGGPYRRPLIDVDEIARQSLRQQRIVRQQAATPLLLANQFGQLLHFGVNQCLALLASVRAG